MRNHPRRPTELVDSDLPWDITDPGRGEARLSDLMNDLTRQPDRRARAIEVATQVARAQSLQGKIREAESTLEQAERMLSSVPDLAPRLRALLERGRLLVLRKTPVDAGSRFLEAWMLASSSAETFFAIDAAQMMSVIDTPKKQVQWTIRALELAEASKEPRVRAWCGHLHCDLGAHFEELLQLTRALESFTRAAACFDQEGAHRSASLARCYMARTMRLLNRAQDALTIQQTVRHELDRSGAPEGVVFEEIGECLLLLKRTEDAENSFRRAYDLLSTNDWLLNNDPARIKRLKTLGKIKQS